ncbi:response regulator [Paenibacillus nanensis]|uniref:Response regulator n=1 Tax=Paenibacillus nanensis TaxID=393251 RepID=A0A3A1VFW8_9BACL|nr:response regulator [Paenibacillus nanensis]RIX59457.1 response regulator [Paenibacillus nanensis]
MPNILIVDDESIYRRGLRKLIGELDDEWQVVGEAKDGYDAFSQLEKLKPDAMLTDIRMPRMDGIQLQQLARKRFPEIECVVISGYDDFSYVQQSMRQGARDYMMKPIEKEELAKVLAMMKERLKERSGAQLKRSREANEITQHAAEHVLKELMRGTASGNDIRLLETMNIAFSHPAFVCMVVKLDKSSVGSERYQQADPFLFQLYIKQVAQEVVGRKGMGYAVVMSETEVAALLNVPDADGAMQEALELADSVRRGISSLSRITVSIGVGRPKKGYPGIAQSYGEAEVALLYRLIQGGDRVLPYPETGHRSGSGADAADQAWQQLESAVSEGRRVLIADLAKAYVEQLCRHADTPETVYQRICKLLIHYYEWASQAGVTAEWLGAKDMKSVLQHVCSLSSREELEETLGKLLLSLTDCLTERSVKGSADPIRRAERYMEQRYAEALSLKDVAEHVYLNAAYFSALFKQKTGKSFVERLTEIRIAEAKRLLLGTDQKLAVISEATGFSSIRHFNRVFKAAAGMSPTEFREKRRNG